MSFTFDDLGKPKSESDSFKINKLSARIAELKSAVDINSTDSEQRNKKIAALEQRRQRLSNGRHKPVELEGRGVDDNWDKNSGPPPSGPLPQQRSKAGFKDLRFKVRRR